jgi:hypothetical protein
VRVVTVEADPPPACVRLANYRNALRRSNDGYPIIPQIGCASGDVIDTEWPREQNQPSL